ncbi:MAG: tryptophan synthase subunit alpha [Myxococcales bacterium]|nr:tryptophan synthase subunit alpha [Myxococcales bacterium]
MTEHTPQETRTAATEGRVARRFASLRAAGRAGLVGYLTAGDPDLARSRELLLAACEAGLDVLELGVPFSDPTADGPVIQEAMTRALSAGASLERALELAASVRARVDTPIVLFGYANPLLARLERDGDARALLDAVTEAGVDGLLVVDLPPEHSAPLREPARARGLDWIGLVAPTTTDARLRRVLSVTSGFVYAVSLTGVTGARLDPSDPRLQEQLARVRGVSELPLAVGFGIRSGADVAALAPQVDAVVVGSALVAAAREGPDALAARVRDLVPRPGPRPRV